MCFVYRGSEKESGKSSVKFRVSFVGMTMLRLPAKRNCAVEESGSGPRKRSPSVEVLEAYLYHRLRRVSIFDGLVSGVPVQDFNTDCGSPQFAVQSGGGWWPRPKKKRDLSTVAAIRRKTSCATRRFWGVWNGRKKAVGGGLLTRPELTPDHPLEPGYALVG